MTDPRLEDLETRVAYQDEALRVLDAVVVRQQQEMERLRRAFEALTERFSALSEQVGGDDPERHQVPPHY